MTRLSPAQRRVLAAMVEGQTLERMPNGSLDYRLMPSGDRVRSNTGNSLRYYGLVFRWEGEPWHISDAGRQAVVDETK